MWIAMDLCKSLVCQRQESLTMLRLISWPSKLKGQRVDTSVRCEPKLTSPSLIGRLKSSQGEKEKDSRRKSILIDIVKVVKLQTRAVQFGFSRYLVRLSPTLIGEKMAKPAQGPGLYTEIGKKARDLLYKDYQSDQRFTFSTISANGVAITSSGTKIGDLLLADISTQLKHANITTDVKVDTSSRLSTTVTVDELAPGLKAIFNAIIPDQSSGKIEVQYLHEKAGISTSVGMTASPIINFSSVVGSNLLALGADASYDTASGNFTKCNTGLSYTNIDLVASLTLNDKGDTLNASYYHIVNPLTYTAVGAEVSHSFSKNENTLTIGTQHSLDPLTSLKAKVNNSGKVSALLQHEWRPRSLVTFSGEVDVRNIEKSGKVGLALALKA